MHINRLFFLLFVVSCICISCGGDGDTEEGTDIGPSNNNPVSSTFSYIVNANSGLNVTPYIKNSGFRTITYALSYLNNLEGKHGYDVTVKKGIYDDNHGEDFPIYVNDNIRLNAEYGAIIKTNGSSILAELDGYDLNAPVIFILDGDAELKNFFIEGNDESVAIISRSGETKVHDNDISTNAVGILVINDSNSEIFRNNIHNNISGLELMHQSKPNIFGNVLEENNSGVLILDSSNPNFGELNNPGGNYLGVNSNYGLCNTTPNYINAVGNYTINFNEEVTVNSKCADGVLVGNISTGFIKFDILPNNKSSIFGVSSSVELLSPIIGESLYTDIPQFIWNMEPRSLVALGVFSDRIKIKNNEIQNDEDIVFYWDSSMPAGNLGSVSIVDGIRYVSGNRTEGGTFRPLERGKIYYWAIWAWDSEGIKIIDSSVEGFFTIVN